MLHLKLKQLRKEKGWTQGVAARELGLKQSYLSKIENGYFSPPDDVLKKIAHLYQTDLAELNRNQPNNRHGAINRLSITIAFSGIVIALLIIGTGALEIAFNGDYFTYQLTSDNKPEQRELVPQILITDEYKGEVFIHQSTKNTYAYQLIGERNVSRQENRILILLGSIILFLATCYLLKNVIVAMRSDASINSKA